MPNTTINTLPYPDGAGPASIALYFQQLAQATDTKLVASFSTVAARDAAIPSPTSGMVCHAAGRLYLYRSSMWVKQGGDVEDLYVNNSAGDAGNVNAGAGAVGILSVNVPASSVPSDVGYVNVTGNIRSSGAGSTGLLTVNVSGKTRSTRFNVTSSNPVPVSVVIPRIFLPGGTFLLAATLTVDAGGVAASMAGSSIFVAF